MASKKLVAPFAAGGIVETPVKLEYRAHEGRSDSHEIVGLKVEGETALKASQTGKSPVSLAVNLGELRAQQVAGSDPNLPVTVTVGTETRTMMPGETLRLATFGCIFCGVPMLPLGVTARAPRMR